MVAQAEQNKDTAHYYLNLALTFALLALWSFLLTATHAYAEFSERKEYQMVNITAGQIAIVDDELRTQRYGLEYRFTSLSGPYGFRLRPAIGVVLATDGALFVYGDLQYDFYLTRKWLLTPGYGVGVFNSSDNIDLGSTVEFRAGLALVYQFENKIRAGMAAFHLSNGGISSQNPGTESLVFSISIPLLNI